jgi:hypothetical protein
VRQQRQRSATLWQQPSYLLMSLFSLLVADVASKEGKQLIDTEACKKEE